MNGQCHLVNENRHHFPLPINSHASTASIIVSNHLQLQRFWLTAQEYQHSLWHGSCCTSHAYEAFLLIYSVCLNFPFQTYYVTSALFSYLSLQGTLPFRLLAAEYGADITYGEEIVDHKFLKCERVINGIIVRFIFGILMWSIGPATISITLAVWSTHHASIAVAI
jgi:hypothetical protein